MESSSCAWCNTTGEKVDEDYWRGHNTRRECRRCHKHWCTQWPIESYDVVTTFCSPACRAWWSRTRKCEVCGEALPLTARSDTLTCSVRCRVALHRQRRRQHGT